MPKASEDVGCATPPTAAVKRLMSAANPETGTVSYTYDADRNLATRLMGGNTTTYCYDQLNELVGKFYGSGSCTAPTVSYTFAGGWRTAAAVSGGTSSSYSYDGLGRVSASSQTTNGVTYNFLQYLYNLADGLTSETYPSGRTVATGYDSAGRPNQVTGINTNYATGVQYAPQGALQQMTVGNSIFTEIRAYNSRLQPCQIQLAPTASSPSCTASVPAGSLLAISYGYSSSNNNGNVQTQTITRQSSDLGTQTWTQSYGYDGVNRLTLAGETGPGTPWSEIYGYDVAGNWWLAASSGLSWSPTNETPQSPGAFGSTCSGGSGSSCTGGVWTGSPNNQVVLSGWSYDGSGNVTQAGSTALGFAYDAENRQVTATIGGVANTYTYDAYGHRVTKTTSQGTTVYVYDGSGELGADYPATSTATGTTYLTADALGSTRLETSAGGGVTRCSDYMPFGEDIGSAMDSRPSCFGSQPPTPEVKFTGKERDAESGFDYFGARYFSAAQGRFSSPDAPFNDQHPGDPQSWNLYSYVRNNPLRAVDPTGQDCVTFDSGGVGDDGQGSFCKDPSLLTTSGVSVNGTTGQATFSAFGNAVQMGDVDPSGGADRVTSQTAEIVSSVTDVKAIAGLAKIGVALGPLVMAMSKSTAAERLIIDELLAAGRTVETVPTGVGKTADFLVDGVPTELKTLTSAGPTTLKNAVQNAAKQGEQILIDARGVNMTPQEALSQIQRAQGNIGGLQGRVTVLTKGGAVTY